MSVILDQAPAAPAGRVITPPPGPPAGGSRPVLSTPRAVATRVHANAMPSGAEAVLRRQLAPGFRNHDVLPGCAGGPDALVATMHWFHDAFDEQRVEVLHAVTEGDLVALHVAFSALHSGFFLGVAPSHRRFTVREMHLVRVADGLEAEHWVMRDQVWWEHELRR
ncbi:ester cyclase [Isoptericola sp. NPDC019693]|uniref:ester cyclase n=1 Tax=Isoptericola sp. NPDC019693 TaxID=3364009 RepID=UPI0037BC3EDD